MELADFSKVAFLSKVVVLFIYFLLSVQHIKILIFPYPANTCYCLTFYFNFFLLSFKYHCLHFPTTTPPNPLPQPQPSPLPTLDLNPFWFCPCVLYRCSWKPFPLFPPLSPPTFPRATVSLFLISMSLVIFCLLVCFVD